jgi:lysophospholipase L1-like esterase
VGSTAAILFTVGFALALRGTLGEPLGEVPAPPPETPVPLPASGRSRVLVLGDSLARGTGDDSGKGFAVEVVEGLPKERRAQASNLAVKGLESTGLAELVASANVRALAGSADLILVSIGANDLSHSIRVGSDPTEAVGAIEEARALYARNLRTILSTLRAANPSAPIVLLSLYDPFGPNAVAGRLGSSVLLQWNSLIQEIAFDYPGVIVVPTFDLFENRPDRLAADRYHPNRRGYSEIARRVLQVVPAPLGPG